MSRSAVEANKEGRESPDLYQGQKKECRDDRRTLSDSDVSRIRPCCEACAHGRSILRLVGMLSWQGSCFGDYYG